MSLLKDIVTMKLRSSIPSLMVLFEEYLLFWRLSALFAADSSYDFNLVNSTFN